MTEIFTIEHLKPHWVEVVGAGKTKKGIKLICSEKVALDLKDNPDFKVTGLSKKEKEKGGE